MNPIARKLTQLLDSSDLELRKSAVEVVTEIGLSSRTVARALARCLEEPNDALRIAALKGLARLGAQDVAHAVVPHVLSSGPLREQAMAVIIAIGPGVVPQLTQLYRESDFHGKRSIITALGRIGTRPAIAFLLKILPGESFDLQKHVTINVCDALDRLNPAAQAPVYQLVQRMVRAESATKNPQILITGAILLGHFRGPTLAARARNVLRALVEKKHPPEARRHAMFSFSRLLSETRLTQPEEGFIRRMLCDEDWHNIAQHALVVFQKVSIPKKALPKLVGLLRDSPHFSVHIHVFERLQASNRPEVAQEIIPFLADPRFRVREAAEAALRKLPSAIESLFNVLVKADDLEVTQRINSILRDFPQETRRKFVDRACQRLLGLFEQNDPHYTSFLEFVRSVDPEPLRKRIYEKARKLKSGRSRDRWERIAASLQLLWDHHLITAEGRYLLAVAHVRLSSKDVAPASRRANLGLQVIRALIYNDRPGLVRRLLADRDLGPEDYFYFGFHFAEAGEEMWPFAKSMLEHVVKKYPRSKVTGPARHKLELHVQMLEKAAEEEQAKGSKKKRSKAASERAPSATGQRSSTKKSATARGGPVVKSGSAKQAPSAPAKVSRSAARSKGPTGKAAASRSATRSKSKPAKKKAPKKAPRKTSKKKPAKKAPKKAPKKKPVAAKKSAKKKPAKKSSPKRKSASPGPIRIQKGGSSTAAKKARKKPRSGAKSKRR